MVSLEGFHSRLNPIKYFSNNYSSVSINNKIAENKINCNETQIILCVDGVPGSYLHFSQFVNNFGDKYRLLVPNFHDLSKLTLEKEYMN